MTFTSRMRAPAVLCALAFLACELVSRPFAEMGLCDDWSYIRTVQVLAATGHLAYNGWATAMLGWQLFVADAFVKLFGFSFSAVRMSTLLIGTVTAFLLQRTMVRAGLNERNAVIGTLALVLSPLYMFLSASFMTDIGGLFAIVLALYCCLRAVQSVQDSVAIAWVGFGALANAICGSSRQIAWLGVLVVVPCALWLMRRRRRVLLGGGVAMLIGWAMVLGGMHWFQLQPYSIPEHMAVKIQGLHTVAYMGRQLVRTLLEIPFMLLAVMVAFFPQLRRRGVGLWVVIAGCTLVYTLLAMKLAVHHGPALMLEPLMGDWFGPHAVYEMNGLNGEPPLILGLGTRILLTFAAGLGLVCVVAALLREPRTARIAAQPGRISWRDLATLIGPLALAYSVLLIPRSASNLLDRYLLVLLVVGSIGLIRFYQDFIAPALPTASVVIVAVVAIFSVCATHDMFAFYRARVELAQELHAAGVADNTLDGGFEHNGWVELQHYPNVNDERLINPKGSFVPGIGQTGLTCKPGGENYTGFLHWDPKLGVSFDRDACRGAAPFAPVSYFRWLGLRTQNLYVVKYGPR